MSVFENMAYGPMIRGLPKADIRARVQKAAEMLELGPYPERRLAAETAGIGPVRHLGWPHLG